MENCRPSDLPQFLQPREEEAKLTNDAGPGVANPAEGHRADPGREASGAARLYALGVAEGTATGGFLLLRRIAGAALRGSTHARDRDDMSMTRLTLWLSVRDRGISASSRRARSAGGAQKLKSWLSTVAVGCFVRLRGLPIDYRKLG